jgi:hypothetical protein
MTHVLMLDVDDNGNAPRGATTSALTSTRSTGDL